MNSSFSALNLDQFVVINFVFLKCHSTEHTTKDCTEEFSALDAEGKPREQYVPEETSIDEIFKGSIASGTNFSNFEKVALQVSGDDVPQYIQSFEGAGLRALVLENVKKSGYKVPTPVQKASIACILARRDLMACAATGSGKTVTLSFNLNLYYSFILCTGRSIFCY